jgi:uncharacterized protein (TIGR02996 family)
MSDRDGLIWAILEDPFDDAPRLVFADWLEENGWGGDAIHLRQDVLGKRVLELPFGAAIGLGQCPSASTPAWARKVVGKAMLRRGFVERVRIPAGQFTPIAGPLFSAQPVCEVVLSDVRPVWSFWAWGWRWESDGERHRDGSQVLPAPLFECLDPQAANTWPSAEAAHEAVNVACVRYGRRLVGLSPLCSV